METFDYIVAGAGAAGCILSARLADSGAGRICLLEAGPADTHPLLHVPAGFIKMMGNRKYTWQFKAEPSPETNGRAIPLPQGRALGGSTVINGMAYNRGQREDYDHWEELGNPGWDYDSVLPYFRRSETYLGAGDDRFRGRQGELFVTANDWIHPVCEAFIQGAGELGIHINADYNLMRTTTVLPKPARDTTSAPSTRDAESAPPAHSCGGRGKDATWKFARMRR